jgi:hypothetical protein
MVVTFGENGALLHRKVQVRAAKDACNVHNDLAGRVGDELASYGLMAYAKHGNSH